MSKPVYQLFVGNNNIASNQIYKALSETGRKELEEQEKASRIAVGAREIVGCDSAWADEMHPWWGVLRFPDVQARIEHTRTLQKIGWLDIADAFTLLGISDDEPKAVTVPNPIYILFMIRNNPVTFDNNARETKEEETARWAVWQESVTRTGSFEVLYCNSYWANEDYLGFGVFGFPSIEACQEHHADLLKIKWPQYISAFTLLGTPIE